MPLEKKIRSVYRRNWQTQNSLVHDCQTNLKNLSALGKENGIYFILIKTEHRRTKIHQVSKWYEEVFLPDSKKKLVGIF